MKIHLACEILKLWSRKLDLSFLLMCSRVWAMVLDGITVKANPVIGKVVNMPSTLASLRFG